MFTDSDSLLDNPQEKTDTPQRADVESDLARGITEIDSLVNSAKAPIKKACTTRQEKIVCPKCKKRGSLDPDGHRKHGALEERCSSVTFNRTTSDKPLRKAISKARTPQGILATVTQKN